MQILRISLNQCPYKGEIHEKCNESHLTTVAKLQITDENNQ